MSAGKLYFKYGADRFGKKNDAGSNDGGAVNRAVPAYRPRIDVVFRKSSKPPDPLTNPEFRARALVDSGADICFIPKAVADVLQLDTDKKSKKTTIGAGGVFTAYRPNIHLEMLYERKRIRIGMVEVAFPEDDLPGVEPERSILIGRSGLFTQYKVTFNDRQKTIELEMFDDVAGCRT